jgi:hypothetical protein
MALDALAMFGIAWATRFTPGQETAGAALAEESVALARRAGDQVALAPDSLPRRLHRVFRLH